MAKPFRFTLLAERDLEEIVDSIATKADPEQADAVLDDLLEAVEHLADSPRMGHRRRDLTDEDRPSSPPSSSLSRVNSTVMQVP